MTPISDFFEAPSRLFLATLAAFIISAILITGLTASLSSLGWIDLSLVSNPPSSTEERQGLRKLMLVSNLIPFAGTALMALLFVFRRKWMAAAGLSSMPRKGSFLYALVFFIAALPFVGWLSYVNMQIPLPDWMQASEDNTDALLKGILTMDSIPELLMALLTVALTPALGEELLMRGVLQRRICSLGSATITQPSGLRLFCSVPCTSSLQALPLGYSSVSYLAMATIGRGPFGSQFCYTAFQWFPGYCSLRYRRV